MTPQAPSRKVNESLDRDVVAALHARRVAKGHRSLSETLRDLLKSERVSDLVD